jgi:hypothetical protein
VVTGFKAAAGDLIMNAIIQAQRPKADTLAALLPHIPSKSHEFCNSLIAWARTKPLTDGRRTWIDKMIAEAEMRKRQSGGPVERQKVEIGDLTPVNALFDKARKHLKEPGIVLAADPALGHYIRIKVAGHRSRQPGLINISVEHDKVPGTDEDQTWLGRVLKDGKFEVSPRLPTGYPLDKVVAAVQRFAADPATGAKESARLTGLCCFCHGPLKDERSTNVGYGKTCASRYDLPWGA